MTQFKLYESAGFNLLKPLTGNETLTEHAVCEHADGRARYRGTTTICAGSKRNVVGNGLSLVAEFDATKSCPRQLKDRVMKAFDTVGKEMLSEKPIPADGRFDMMPRGIEVDPLEKTVQIKLPRTQEALTAATRFLALQN